MRNNDLKDRTKQFALRILKLANALPNTDENGVIRKQIMRCGTSVASNYRASCRAKSKLDFIAKLSIVEEEADESAFWMEIIVERKLLKKSLVEPLLHEAYELTAIMVSSKKSARKNS
ncbi:MAG: four helix bundle protein [Candidatus Falkowbacteria bacterium]